MIFVREISIMSEISYQEEVQQQSEYANYIYENKTIRNTLEHAEQDVNNAEEYLIRAKNYKREGNELQLRRACRSATKDAVDSTEKFLKVGANVKQVQNHTFLNGRGKRERVQNTHYIRMISENVGEAWLSNEETEFMDSFIDIENGCYNSHTGLSYGNVDPTLEEAEKAVEIKRKAENGVKELRNRVYTQKILHGIRL